MEEGGEREQHKHGTWKQKWQGTCLRDEGGQQEAVRKGREEQRGEGEKRKKAQLYTSQWHPACCLWICKTNRCRLESGAHPGKRRVVLSRTMDRPRITYMVTDVQMLWFFKILFIYFVYVCLHICPCTTCMQYLQRPKESIGSRGTEVTESCEARGLCECWELKPGSLKRSQCS